VNGGYCLINTVSGCSVAQLVLKDSTLVQPAFVGSLLLHGGKVGAFTLQDCNILAFTNVIQVLSTAANFGNQGSTDINFNGCLIGSGTNIQINSGQTHNYSVNQANNVIFCQNKHLSNLGGANLYLNSSGNDWTNVAPSQLINASSTAGSITLNGTDILWDVSTGVAAVATTIGQVCQSTNGGAAKAGLAVVGVGGKWYALATGAAGINTDIN